MGLRTLVAAGIAAVAVALPAATAGAGKVATVEVGNGFYSPGAKTVRQGDKVRFEWVPSLEMHNVHVKSGPERFKSPTQAAGTWSRRFAKPGKFVLYCTQHEDMRMKLTVKRR
jgi:plastocyanin